MSGTGSAEAMEAADAGAYDARLARARRELPIAPMGARDLAQLARNPGCTRRLVNSAARVDMAKLATTIFGTPVREHGSPQALATGIVFEGILLRDEARRLIDLFTGAGWLTLGVQSFVDVQAAFPDADAASLAQRETLTRDLIAQKLRGDPTAPAIIWHGRLTLAVTGVASGVVHIEPDCLVASPTDRMYRPVEAKSFRHRGPRTNSSDVANARMQAAVEILALRDTVANIAAATEAPISERELDQLVSDRCGLITRKRVGMTARLSAITVRREITLMRRLLLGFRAHVERAVAANTVVLDRRDGQESLPNALRDDCRDFCYLAAACEASARQRGEPIALGSEMQEAIGIVGNIPRLIALLDGREPVRTDDERRVVRAFQAATVHLNQEMRRVG